MAWSSDAILTALSQVPERECVNYERLAELTSMQLRSLQNATQLLLKHGFITRTSKGCHKLTAAGRAAVSAQQPVRPGKHAPNALRQRAWENLRMLNKADLKELCMLSAEGGERDIHSALGKYVRALERSGYLLRLPVKARDGVLRYRLVRNSGLLAPVWRPEDKVMIDPNTNGAYPCG